MPEFFGSDGPYFLQFLVIFLVILVLLMGAALLFRRLFGRGLSLSAGASQRGRQPRLGIVDIYELDRQRQLILLRRDNVEHLLLIGGPNDVVVERNVVRSAGARMPNESLIRPEPASDMAPAPEPAALPDSASPRFEMPIVVPPPLPGEEPVPAKRTPPLDPALFEPESEASSASEPVRSRIGIAQVGRILRRTPPPLVDPGKGGTGGTASVAPMPPSPDAPGIPPTIESGEPRPVDAAILSDMARQLETALRKPSSAVTPPPSKPAQPLVEEPAPNAPAQQEAAPAGMARNQDANPLPPAALAETLPVEPKPTEVKPAEVMPTQAVEPAPPPKPMPRATPVAKPAPKPTPDPVPATDRKTGPEPKPAVPEPTVAQPEPKPARESKPEPKPQAELKPAPTPTPAPAPAAKPAPSQAGPASEKPATTAEKPATQQPFTLEEIETEFARLLGRHVGNKN